MGKMTVFHGSYMAVEKPEIRKGRNTKDFGPGFYCTVIREQAQRWAKRYVTPVVSTYTVRLNTCLKILEFKEMTEEWLDFIMNCRSGKDSTDYDLVVGGVANDKVFNTVELFFDGLIDKAEAINRLRYDKPNLQICFRTEKALSLLHFEGSETV